MRKIGRNASRGRRNAGCDLPGFGARRRPSCCTATRMPAMLRQRTMKALVRTVGIGLHSGAKVQLVLRPAAADTGVVFRRTDTHPPVEIAASADAVGDTRMASTLERNGVRVSTVEHLMSALAGLGVDNCYV